MELCKKVQVEESVVHVEESTNFFTSLRFSLLASTWFPCRLGTILWSALHIILLAYKSLMLLAIFTTYFVIAVYIDAFTLPFFICLTFLPCVAVLYPLVILFVCLGMSFAVVIAWIWLLISCNCRTMPRRAPGQTLAQYFLTAGGTLTIPPVPVERSNAAGLCASYWNYLCDSFIANLLEHVKSVSIPYWRVDLGNLCREIVPWYDAIVI